MRNSKKLFNIKLNNIIIIVFLVILIFTALTNYFVKNKLFDKDELEQIHLAWLVKEDKIIYKDFAESHGPLLPFLNAFLWQQFNLKDELSTLFFYRYINLFYLILILGLTYQIARLFYGYRTGLLSLILLLSAWGFLNKAVETRPDNLQIVFWLAGLYLLFKTIKKPKNTAFLIAFCFFLAFLVNAKVLILLTITIVAFLWSFKHNKKAIKYLIEILLAFVGFNFLFFLFLLMQDLLLSYFRCVFYDKSAVFMKTFAELNSYKWSLLSSFIYHSKFVVVLFLFGFLKIIYKVKTQEEKFLLYLTIGLMFSVYFFGFYQQWFLAVLPFVTIIAAMFLAQLLDYYRNNKKIFAEYLVYLLVVIVIISTVLSYYVNVRDNNNADQLIKAAKVLFLTNPQDKIFYLSDVVNPAYVFRNNLLFYWQVTHYEKSKYLNNKHMYEILEMDNFRDNLQQNKPKALLISSREEAIFSATVRNYIKANYYLVAEGLWLHNSLLNKYYARK